MANITASDVKELREMTGCGMMDCKRALVEADGKMRLLRSSVRRALQRLPRRQAESLPRVS